MSEIEEAKSLIADMWEEINPRRAELIRLQVSKTATPDELSELRNLQSLCDRMITLIAPLPSEKDIQKHIFERWDGLLKRLAK